MIRDLSSCVLLTGPLDNQVYFAIIRVFPTETIGDNILPLCCQSLKILISQHLLGQHPFYLVLPWKQVCPEGSTFDILELPSLLQLCHRKATEMPKIKKEKTLFNSTPARVTIEPHNRHFQTSTPISDFPLKVMGPDSSVHTKLVWGKKAFP